MDLAHGLGGGADLPISPSAAAFGGAIAIAISFAVLALAWRRPRFEAATAGWSVPRLTAVLDAPETRIVLQATGLLGLAFVVWSVAAGPDDLGVNPAFGLIFVVLWVGLVPASLLLGPVIRAISPARTIYALILTVLRRDRAASPGAELQTVGWWPAAITLLSFVWLELVAPDSTTLNGLTGFLVTYLVVVLGGALVLGESWFARADPFEVYSTLAARLSPWHRDRTGTIALVNPLRHLAETPSAPGLVAVVSVLLGSTAFDSLTGSTRWLRFTQSTDLNVVLLETALLLATVFLVGATFSLATAVPAHLVDMPEARKVPARLAHSLLPIVIGYVAAHYLTLLVETGQFTLVQMSDPLGRGWNLFGTADREVDLWLSLHPTFLATTKVVLIVAGHLIGALSAHDRALAVLPVRHRVAAQVPLLLVMVAYTFGGLTLLLGV